MHIQESISDLPAYIKFLFSKISFKRLYVSKITLLECHMLFKFYVIYHKNVIIFLLELHIGKCNFLRMGSEKVTKLVDIL
jgi:hypothetical protein